MIKLVFLVILPLAWSYGEAYSRGGGAYSFVDSSGNRYGGTYGLKDGKIISTSGDPFPPPVGFADPIFTDNAFPGDDFGPTYFANLENILQEAFKSSIENQRLAFDAAKKAYDLTSNKAHGLTSNKATSYIPPLPTRFPAFNNFPTFGFPVRGFGMPFPAYGNSAFASAAAGPGYNHQIAAINPANPNNPNVNQINHYADTTGPRNGFYSVSSNSYSSSANVNGKEISNRGAETLVNDNGQITHYKVQS